MVYMVISMLLAVFLGIVLDWPLWLVIAIILSGSLLSYLKFKGSSWTGPLTVIAIAFLMIVISSQFLRDKMPLTSSLVDHIWISHDVKTAAKSADSAIKAKEAILKLQIEKEDESANKIKRIYEEKGSREALKELRRIADEGNEVRNIIASDSDNKKIANSDGAKKLTEKKSPTRAIVASNELPREEKISLVPTVAIKMRHISPSSGKIDDYAVRTFKRTPHEIDIRCQDNFILIGTRTGDGEYAGRWSQGVVHGPFRIKFKGVNKATGTIGVTEGDIPLSILPL